MVRWIRESEQRRFQRAKPHWTVRIPKNFAYILSAQFLSRSIFTFVVCGSHSPRLKDCEGLVEPNTLK